MQGVEDAAYSLWTSGNVCLWPVDRCLEPGLLCLETSHSKNQGTPRLRRRRPPLQVCVRFWKKTQPGADFLPSKQEPLPVARSAASGMPCSRTPSCPSSHPFSPTGSRRWR